MARCHPGKETPVAVPNSSVLSHVSMNIITNNLYEDVEGNSVIVSALTEVRGIKQH